MRRFLLALPALLLVLGCEASLADREKEARAALDARDFAKARELSEAALASSAAGGDAPTSWRLEQIRVEALANDKQSGEVVLTLERLSNAYPTQVTPGLYRSLAAKLKAAGDKSGAIDVLAEGHEKYPQEDEAFIADIDALKKESLDPAQVEKLKALGYL
ncbi:MAG: hypothetical protein FJ144_17630 [Deltaproteobacteria bacterium]|nr:hypothetical protein [Deltaproteobacteria bacterium]